MKFEEMYAYESIEEYETLAGYKMNDAFKTGWNMARLTNKQFGFTEPDDSIKNFPKTIKK